MDEADLAAPRIEEAISDAIGAASRAVASIPVGESGECSGCGDFFTRLVDGYCGRCRDKFSRFVR